MQATTLTLALASLICGVLAGWLLRRSLQPQLSPFPPEPEPNAPMPPAPSDAEERAELEHQLAQAHRVIQGLKGARPAFIGSGPSNHPDDFGAIDGVDPLAAMMLNNLGIHRYNQLASLTPDDVAWVASRMEILPSRIEEQDWVGQARRMAILYGQSLLG